MTPRHPLAPRLRLASLPLLLCSLAILATPAGAATRMRFQPEVVHLGLPFQLVLAADFEFAVVEQAYDGARYTVVTRRTGVASPGQVAFSQVLWLEGPESAVVYPIEWRERPASGPDVLVERSTFQPLPGLALEVPAVITDQDDLSITFSGTAPCPTFSEWLEGYPENFVGVAYSYGCMPNDYYEHFEHTPTPRKLPAGQYRVVVRSLRDFPYLIERPLTVLPTDVKLQGSRFAIDLRWDDGTTTGKARVTSMPGPDSAVFYFFDPSNWEFLVKVLDGCAINGHYWVFGAASTAVGYTLTVTDLERPELAPRVHTNAFGQPAAAITDIVAFPCQESNP